jgi:magnesium-transporting ATPase (P-type)
LVNVFIGFFFEIRAEKTLEKLKKIFKPKAKVLRDKELREIPVEELVPGDIVFVEEGDIIPADLRFFEVENLKIDESILTGESLPVEKDIKPLDENTPIPERGNIGLMGSYVVEGRGKGIVFATGVNTYIGSIYEKFKKIEQFAPHFERLSKDLILKMFFIAFSTSILIFYFAFQRNYLWSETLLFVLSSFISSIPEGLPVIITVLLVVSAYGLIKKNVFVRNFQAVENLSVINLLLSDKTGTLTENVMTVRKIYVDNEEIEVTGEGYSLEGKFLKDGKEINIFENYPLIKLLNISAVVSEAETIKKLKSAGIDMRILTGDHKETAVYIAKEVGFENLNVLDQKEIENLTEKELLEKIKDTYIFARITPETKLKILELYQKLGFSVAYIGDGVNDVLGLKNAEIGICMGKRGSEIAKSASDIILLDDNLENLIESIKEGRKVYNNLKRVVFFLITTNVAESLTILSALITGLPFILRPTHILFLNFVTDTLVGTGLAFEKEHGYELISGPRKAKESLISFDLIPFLLIMATIMTILTFLIFQNEYPFDLDKARTYAFLVMSFTQIYNALNLRSFNQSILKLNIKGNLYLILGFVFSVFLQYFVIFNPQARNILNFAPIKIEEFVIIFMLSSLVLIIGEIYKAIKRKIGQ